MFLNLKDGQITISSSRLPEADVTTQDDLYQKFIDKTEACLTASIENKLDLYSTPDGWIAKYTGVTGSDEFVFEKEAYHIEGITIDDIKYNAAIIWGTDLDVTRVTVHE